MKYRKKPVDVEAVQWTKDDAPSKIINFTNHLVQVDDVNGKFKVYDRLHDEWIPFYWNDWIIKGIKGEFYPCRPDVFAASYDEVDADEEVEVERTETWGGEPISSTCCGKCENECYVDYMTGERE